MKKTLTTLGIIGATLLPVNAAEITLEDIYADALEEFEPNERKEIQSFIKKSFPDALKELNVIAKENEDATYQLLDEMIGCYEEYMHLSEEEPEEVTFFINEIRTELKSTTLGIKIRIATKKGDTANAAALTSELKSLLAKLFEKNIKQAKEELKELENEVKEIRAFVSKREKYKEKIIQRRFDELCGANDDLEW